LRIPVDDWSVALALVLRTFPMLIDEFRVLYAARRLRPKPTLRTRGVRTEVSFRLGPVQYRSLLAVTFSSLDGVKSRRTGSSRHWATACPPDKLFVMTLASQE
jgi:Cobalt transport protein